MTRISSCSEGTSRSGLQKDSRHFERDFAAEPVGLDQSRPRRGIWIGGNIWPHIGTCIFSWFTRRSSQFLEGHGRLGERNHVQRIVRPVGIATSIAVAPSLRTASSAARSTRSLASSTPESSRRAIRGSARRVVVERAPDGGDVGLVRSRDGAQNQQRVLDTARHQPNLSSYQQSVIAPARATRP